MKSAIFLIFTLILLSGCINEGDGGTGKISIKAPSGLSYDYKSVISNFGDTDIFTDERCFRINILIESGGCIVGKFTLSEGEEKKITVPSGVALDITAALYYAQSADSDAENCNIYLAKDIKKGVSLMYGETKYIQMALDLTKEQKVDFYIDYNFNKITGGAANGDDGVYFSMSTYNSDGYDIGRVVKYTKGGAFSTVRTIPDKIFAAKGLSDGNNRNIMVISKGCLYLENTLSMDTQLTNKLPLTPSEDINLMRAIFLRSYIVNDDLSGDRYYYLISYKDGYFAFNYNATNPNSWGFISEDIDLSMFDSINLYESFMLDLEQDKQIDSNIFFATKVGLFYLNDDIVDAINTGDKDVVLQKFKKTIRVKNDADEALSILITRVIDDTDRLLLGTKRGVYYIDKKSAAWRDFVAYQENEYRIFTEGVHKLTDFSYDETINYMGIIQSKINGKVLVITTPRRILFKRFSDNNEVVVTVFDGIPFVPLKKYSNMESLNFTYYKEQYTSIVRELIYYDGKYFLITDYGLGAIDDEGLFDN